MAVFGLEARHTQISLSASSGYLYFRVEKNGKFGSLPIENSS
jgi:hypothetical protein